MIDTEYRRTVTRLLAELVDHAEGLVLVQTRIAIALERANATNPIDAINRILADVPPDDGASSESTPDREAWRFR